MKTQQQIKDEIMRLFHEQDKLFKYLAGSNETKRYDAGLLANMKKINSSIATLMWVLEIESDLLKEGI